MSGYVITAVATVWVGGIIAQMLFYALFPTIVEKLLRATFPEVFLDSDALDDMKKHADALKWTLRDILEMVFWPVILVWFALRSSARSVRQRFSRCSAVVLSLAAVTACSGCLSVVRLGKLDDGTVRHWSEEQQRYVTYKVDNPGEADLCSKFGLYPTMKMRWQILRLSWHWAPKRYWWGQHVGLPIAWTLILPGAVFDFAVDTISLPWDWKYRHNVSPDLCAGIEEERVYRSSCVRCGATSDGEFARCKRKSDRGTENWRKYYGVCPDCIEAVKADGYYFED